MKTMYEGMFILPNSLNDEQMDEGLASVKSEIERCGGEVKSLTRIGKRTFARPMHKKDSGQYVVIEFEMEGTQVDAFRARCKLNEYVFRVQVVLASEKTEEPAVAAAE